MLVTWCRCVSISEWKWISWVGSVGITSASNAPQLVFSFQLRNFCVTNKPNRSRGVKCHTTTGCALIMVTFLFVSEFELGSAIALFHDKWKSKSAIAHWSTLSSDEPELRSLHQESLLLHPITFTSFLFRWSTPFAGLISRLRTNAEGPSSSDSCVSYICVLFYTGHRWKENRSALSVLIALSRIFLGYIDRYMCDCGRMCVTVCVWSILFLIGCVLAFVLVCSSMWECLCVCPSVLCANKYILSCSRQDEFQYKSLSVLPERISCRWVTVHQGKLESFAIPNNVTTSKCIRGRIRMVLIFLIS